MIEIDRNNGFHTPDFGRLNSINVERTKQNLQRSKLLLGKQAQIFGCLKCNSKTKLDCAHFLSLSVVGISVWCIAWCVFGEAWSWAGGCSRAAGVVAAAWAGGRILHSATGLPALLAALIVGILARHYCILDMRMYLDADSLLRKIYPVIILGKASLTWDLNYIKLNWQRVLALGTLPWTIEALTLTSCFHLCLGFPCSWSMLVGCMHASMTCVVVLPAVRARAAGAWPRLLAAAGGLDTALSVGVFGVIYTYIFCDSTYLVRYLKVGLTMVLGVCIGAIAGGVACLLPGRRDRYVAELRVTLVLTTGLCIKALSTLYHWHGLGSVAVLVCNAVAGHRWRLLGWRRLDNPAVTAYRVLWAAFEPALFAFTGTFFLVNHVSWRISLIGVGIVAACLATRLAVTALICWEFSFKEKLFMCCTTMPKSIPEAALCPMVLETLMIRGHYTNTEIQNAETIITLTIQTIFITTTIGCFLTNYITKRIFDNSNKNGDIEAPKSIPNNEQGRF